MDETRRLFNLLLSIKKPPATQKDRIEIQEQRLRDNDAATTKDLRDRDILAVLIGCGLRRSEVAAPIAKPVTVVQASIRNFHAIDNTPAIVPLLDMREHAKA